MQLTPTCRSSSREPHQSGHGAGTVLRTGRSGQRLSFLLCAFAAGGIALATAPVFGARARKGAPPAVREEPSERDDDSDDSDDSDDGESKAGGKRGGPTVRASSEVSAYTDTDSVHVLSPTIAGSVSDEVAGWTVAGSYLVDAVSAASVDIVSTASSHWVERRHVGAASADFKTSAAQVSVAGGFSREPDYLSIGGGGVISLELADKNFMPFIGGSYGHDLVGRTGDPQDTWPTMNKVSAKLGATFVVNRSTIASLSFDGIFERGYLAKPYRYLPVVAPGVAASIPVGAPVSLVKSLNEFSVAENVPTARNRFSLAGKLAHRFESSTFRADQRLYTDNWGLMASTTDIHEYLDLGSRIMVWPHLRAHVQRGVSFWRRILEEIPDPAGGNVGFPSYRAGDRELGPLYTLTAGFGIRARLNADVRAPWTLSLQVDGIFTRYLDAIYISQRRALFSALSLEGTF